MASASRFLTAVALLASCCLGARIAQSQEAKDPQATGLIPIGAEEEAKIRKQWKKVEHVGLNQLGLKRVNAARKAKGQAELSSSSSVPLGAETSSEPAGSEALSALPSYVDNSTLKYFPPIRSQGSLGSCVSWCTTYYQMTHNTALARDWDAKSGGDLYRFSPKWTYNFVNGGGNNGTYVSDNYNVLVKHGAARWSEFPYDSNCLAWCTNPAVWRGAIDCRPEAVQYIYSVSTTGLDQVKQLLTDGYVVTFATYVTSWQFKNAGNDPATSADDAFAGKGVCYWLNGTVGGHGMTFVGYSDDIWVDINGNGLVDGGEKGALRVANSWGTSYKEAGFTWLAYDALRATSAVAGGPSAGRVKALQSDMCWHLPARASYTPKVVAEFTVNHLKRNQLRMNLGISATNTTSPSTTWYPGAISFQGGAYAFNGTTTAVDGTFFLDFTDIAPTVTSARRWYLGTYDSTAGDAATLKSFKLYEVTAGGDLLAGSAVDVPQTADAAQKYVWIDYTLSSGNIAPVALAGGAPTGGAAPLPVDFSGSDSYDPDGTIVSYVWNFGDGKSDSGPTATHTYAAAGTFTVTLTVTDDKGATATDTLTVTVSPDPNQLNAPSGLGASVSGSTVTLNWSDNSGCEDGFYVERGVTSKGKTTWSRVATVGANAATFSQTVANGTYKYRVQAFSAAKGVTAYSNEVQVTVGSKGGKPSRK